MKFDDFEFVIASPSDREKLICEIYYKDEIMAEISQETNDLILEIYPLQNGEYWKIPFFQFQKALEIAKTYLMNGTGSFDSCNL